LLEILEAVDAAQELERRAQMGAEDVVRIGRLTVPKGHHGNAAESDWIAAMMLIYQNITGKIQASPHIRCGARDLRTGGRRQKK
jgi:hypothetical protein